MATLLTMPRLSDTMTTGKILDWKKKVGDIIEPGDVLAEIESDKATMEFEAFEEGVLLEIRVPAGQSAPIGETLAVLGEAGESTAATESIPIPPPIAIVEPKAEPKLKKEVVPPKPTPIPVPVPTAPPTAAPAPVEHVATDRLIASPIAMRLAAEKGIDLRAIHGSGPDGRITRTDVEQATTQVVQPIRPIAAVEVPKTTPPPSTHPLLPKELPAARSDAEPMSQMRSAIARRMTEGWQSPMFTVTVEVGMDRVVELRSQWKEIGSEVVPSVNDFIVAACARALQEYPKVNASYAGEAIQYHDHQDIGIAVALDDGLITPVIRNAGSLTVPQIAVEAKRLSEKAKAKKLQPEEFSGSTFTISNLGMFDVVHFTAIVNPPEAAILAVGSVREVPVANHGELSIEHRMLMTISGDHRVIDGATGARFLNAVKRWLESPLALIV